MKKNEISKIAKALAEKCASMNEISKEYKTLKEQYGDDAKVIVNAAKEYKKEFNLVIDEKRDAVLAKFDAKMVLEAEFKALSKVAEFKRLCWIASMQSKNVVDFVAKWYPHTIDGQPAKKVWDNEEKTLGHWETRELTRSNATGVLVSCLRNLAKGCKKQTKGTINHEEGEKIEK